MKSLPIQAALFTLCIGGLIAEQAQAQVLPYLAFGTNASYFPNEDLSGGPYNGFGIGFPLGPHMIQGEVATTPTDNQFVQEWETDPLMAIGFFGAIWFRGEGEVELIPMFDDQGMPTGQFTAEWEGTMEIIGGTGLFSSVMSAFQTHASHRGQRSVYIGPTRMDMELESARIIPTILKTLVASQSLVLVCESKF